MATRVLILVDQSFPESSWPKNIFIGIAGPDKETITEFKTGDFKTASEILIGLNDVEPVYCRGQFVFGDPSIAAIAGRFVPINRDHDKIWEKLTSAAKGVIAA